MNLYKGGKVELPKKFIISMLLLGLCLVLVACGDPKIGDIFILKRNTLGGVTVNSMEDVLNEVKSFEDLGDPDSMEEYVDHDAIPSFSVGTVVRVIETSDKDRMVRIQNVYPMTEEVMKMWIDIEDLNHALQ